jgi:hypothetical protein
VAKTKKSMGTATLNSPERDRPFVDTPKTRNFKLFQEAESLFPITGQKLSMTMNQDEIDMMGIHAHK